MVIELMRIFKAVLCCLISVVLVVVTIFAIFPLTGETVRPSIKAEYADYLNGYDIILDGKNYYEKTFDAGWYVGYPKGDTVYVYGDWILLYDTAYFLAENNKGKYGIKIEESSGADIYVFPSDIPYPDFRYDMPDRVDIVTDDNVIVLGSGKSRLEIKLLCDYIQEIKDSLQIRKITKVIYENSVYELLPEEIKDDEELNEIKIRLNWDNYPYYFEQILTKNTDGVFIPAITKISK